MLQYNTMRFLTDNFNPYIKQALLISNTPVDLTNFNRLDQIIVQGNEPTGSKRRFLFKMDGKVYKFSGQNLVEYTGSIDIDNVLENGNSAAQLQAVNNNSRLVGKNIFPIIALYTESVDIPTANLIFNASFSQEILDFNKELTPHWFYDENDVDYVEGEILGFSWDIDTVGDAQAGFKVQLYQNDSWSDYLTLTEAKGQIAKAVRPKFYYHVDAVNGNNSVHVRRFKVHWSPNLNFRVYGKAACLTSIVKNFNITLSSCVLVVRHEPLDDASINADVCFQKKRKAVSDEVLGYKSSGIYQTAHKFIPATLKVFVNGNRAEQFSIQPDNQSFHVYESQWASAPYSVSCDYYYDPDDEIWLPMTADSPEPTDNGLYASRFYLKNPYDSSKQLAAIRITLTDGENSKSSVKVATGEEQRVTLSRIPWDYDWDYDIQDVEKIDHIDYDDASNSFLFKADPGVQITFSYSWIGKSPVITGWQAAFAT